ncbi:MAG TPA: alkaline phosphatase family protein [Acidimicrobiales bacterium]|nr:alkaline phosphatase family protein [Acidimicrobiales bacterium]
MHAIRDRRRRRFRRGQRRAATATAGASLLAALFALGAGSGPAAAAPAGRPHAGRAGIPAFGHVFVVVEENLGYAGTLATPGFAALAKRYALATQYYGVSHPSLPNYLALTGGSTFGITSDCTDCYVRAPNLASQLGAAKISFGAYMEGAPGPCFLAQYGGNDYASKHDPFRYYDNVRSSRDLCSRIVPESRLPALLSGPGAKVPRFVWVTPDLCNDGHDCAATVAASWLTRFVNQVTASAAWKQNGALFVTWDESDSDNSALLASGKVAGSGGGGRVATFVIAPHVRRGLRVGIGYNHYSLLATIEDAFGLQLLGQAAHATPLAAFFAQPAKG